MAKHRRRWGRAALISGALLLLLGGTAYQFVVKSFPYETPQGQPPLVALSAAQAAAFKPIAAGLPAVPVLSWRDVSQRKGLLVTTPARFAAQLATLRRYGYQSVTLGQLGQLAAGKPAALPARPVLITFDDGLATDWTTVDPILRRYGFRALVFMNPDNVALKSPSYFLTRGELAAMAASGRWDIGVELPGGWPAPAQAAAGAERARSRLSAETGQPVTAFGWPVLAYPTPAGLREPAATYRALHGQFGLVFDRPGSGAAEYIQVGDEAQPLPRLNVTSRDDLASLSTRLRTGAPAPIPASPLSLPWRQAGGRCAVTAATMTIRASQFALCTAVANGDRWIGYRLTLDVSGTPGSTAIVELRSSAKGVAEIAIGASTVTVKERVSRSWHVLDKLRVQPQPPATPQLPGSKPPPPLMGGATVQLAITLDGADLSARVQPVSATSGAQLATASGVGLDVQLASDVRSGVIALGMVGPGTPATVTFRHLVAGGIR